MRTPPAIRVPPPLTGPFAAAPAADGVRPLPATEGLVRTQVAALLASSPAFHALPDDTRRRLARDLTAYAAYAAELVRDDWYQSERLGQRPVLKRTERVAATGQAAADDFRPAAAGQVARVTRETLRAIAFPTFVSDLIRGTFRAVVQASVEQMEAYCKLLENVGKTVDQFMADNISDDQARDYLAQAYPEHLTVRDRRVTVRDGAPETPPDFRRGLGLGRNVSADDDPEESLVPAARRKLAQTRLQMLSTMVLMGVNRIVVKAGKVRATMGFHIDASDRAHAEQATDFDVRSSLSASLGFGPWSASASVSVAYVSSTRSDSDAELNVNADLTGEVELRFESDYFPLERFLDGSGVERVRSNTAVPEANAPAGEAGGVPSARTHTPRPRRTSLPPIGTPLPPPREPTTPTPVTPRAEPVSPPPPPPPATPTTATPTPATATPPAAAAPAAPATPEPVGAE